MAMLASKEKMERNLRLRMKTRSTMKGSKDRMYRRESMVGVSTTVSLEWQSLVVPLAAEITWGNHKEKTGSRIRSCHQRSLQHTLGN